MSSDLNEHENGHITTVDVAEQNDMSATGFLIFTMISGCMAFYILLSVIQTCSRYRELKQKSSPN